MAYAHKHDMKPAIKPTRYFPDSLLNQCRQQTDAPADLVIAQVNAQTGRGGVGELFRWLGDTKNKSLAAQPEVVQQYFVENQALPAWADQRLMQQGMAFFRSNRNEIAILLGCLSLPYCYAAADGAQVLYLSQRLHQDAFKRLQETGAFVFSVTKPDAWQSGEAQHSILKVRLMHAAIRFFTAQSGKWNAAWGKPINQEDMAGTNTAFSYVVIRGLRQIGTAPSDDEAEAYLHLWNVIGYLMGVSENLLPENLREAFILDKAIAKRQFKASEAGKILTKGLLDAFDRFIENPLLKNLPAAQMRWFLGDEVANLLAVPAVVIEKRLVRFLPTTLIFG